MQRRRFLASTALLIAGASQAHSLLAQTRRTPDVVFVPTPNAVVDKMLEVSGVTAKDIVYDLGSGDGRIPITAAQRYGARGVGIDINPIRIAQARKNAREARVEDKVRFIEGDLFEANIGEATVVTLYLLNSLNAKLRPQLMRDLKPGTRVVSHAFNMGDWQPERTETVNSSTVYLWRIPAAAAQS